MSPSTLTATSTQTFDTGLADGHLHMVSLTPTQLSTLASGGTVTVTSTIANSHQHMFSVTCQ